MTSISREKLCEEVWSEPMTTVAKDFGITSRQLPNEALGRKQTSLLRRATSPATSQRDDEEPRDPSAAAILPDRVFALWGGAEQAERPLKWNELNLNYWRRCAFRGWPPFVLATSEYYRISKIMSLAVVDRSKERTPYVSDASGPRKASDRCAGLSRSMSPKRTSLLLAAGIIFSALALFHQAPAAATPGEEKADAHSSSESPSTSEPVLPPDAVTNHTLVLDNGSQLTYEATAGSVTLTDADGGKTAEIFYVSYSLSGAPPTKRPITFVFNGGPGASAAYLHMAAIGPRVLDFGNGRLAITPDRKIISNPDSWLPFTDLVFVDPVGTGYSRAMNSVKDVGKAFWGIQEDVDALSKIVWLILAKQDRIGSPVYLAGESYGGFRAAKLVKHLPADEGIAVTGATLISPVLEFSLLDDDDFNPLPWALLLPSYAAVALEARDKLSPEALQGVEQFALGDYLTTLATTPYDPSKSSAMYARVAKDIGLPEPLVARWHGRVPVSVFTKEIHHEKGEVASSYDGSVDGADPYPSAPKTRGADPVFKNIIAPLTTGFVAYLRNELKFKTERPYVLLNREVSHKWDWEQHDPSGAVGAVDDLREGLALNPSLKVAVVHGMTDLVTPYMTSRYVMTHLPIPLTRGRVSLHIFPGGHMMYLRPDSRAALARNAQSIYPGGK